MNDVPKYDGPRGQVPRRSAESPKKPPKKPSRWSRKPRCAHDWQPTTPGAWILRCTKCGKEKVNGI